TLEARARGVGATGETVAVHRAQPGRSLARGSPSNRYRSGCLRFGAGAARACAVEPQAVVAGPRGAALVLRDRQRGAPAQGLSRDSRSLRCDGRGGAGGVRPVVGGSALDGWPGLIAEVAATG